MASVVFILFVVAFSSVSGPAGATTIGHPFAPNEGDGIAGTAILLLGNPEDRYGARWPDPCRCGQYKPLKPGTAEASPVELEHEFDELVADRRAEIMDCLKWYYRYHDREHVTWQLSWQWPALFYDRCACGGAAASFYPLIFHYPDTSDDLADDPAEDQADDQAENPIDDPVILPLHAFWFVSWNYENCTLSYAGGDFAGTRLGGSSGHGGGMSGGPGGAGGLGLGGPGLLLDELLDLQPHPDPTPLPIPLPAPGLMFPAALVALGLLGWVRRRARIAS